jgi:hypothetical protein
MSGGERPVCTPVTGSEGCRVLRDQLAEAIDAICWQAGLVRLAQVLDPAGERPHEPMNVEAAPERFLGVERVTATHPSPTRRPALGYLPASSTYEPLQGGSRATRSADNAYRAACTSSGCGDAGRRTTKEPQIAAM